MKKLLTLMLAVAMIFSFASVAMAADANVSLVYTAAGSGEGATDKLEFDGGAVVDGVVTINKGETVNVSHSLGNVTYKLGTANWESGNSFGNAGTFTLTAKYVITPEVPGQDANEELGTEATPGTPEVAVTATVTVKVLDTDTTPVVTVGGKTVAKDDFDNIKFAYTATSVELTIAAPATGEFAANPAIVVSGISSYVVDTSVSPASVKLTLAEGDDDVTITVKTVAESGDPGTYTLSLERIPASTDNSITVDEKSAGSTIEAMANSVKFDYELPEFAKFAEDNDYITITSPSGVTKQATVKVEDNKIAISDMEKGKSYTLNIKVTSEAGATHTNTFTVERVTSTDATITVTGVTDSKYTASAEEVKLSYTLAEGAAFQTEGDLAITFKDGTATTATVKEENGKIVISGMENGKEYTLTIKTIAEDEHTAKTTTITITCTVTTPLMTNLYLDSNKNFTSSDSIFSNLNSSNKYSTETEDSTMYLGFNYGGAKGDITVKLNGRELTVDTNSTYSNYYVKLNALGQQSSQLDDEVVITLKTVGGENKYYVDLTKLDDVDGSALIKSGTMDISSSSTKTSSSYTKYFTFDPYFHVERLDYDVLIDEDYEEDYIYIHFTVKDDYDVKVSGATKIEDDDTGSYVEYVYRIATPATNKDVKVEIEIDDDGDENTYELNFCFEASSDAFLDDVDAYIGTSSKRGSTAAMYPAFNKDITEYVILMPYDTSEKYIYFDIEEGKDCDFEADSDLERDKIGSTYYYIDSVSSGETTYTIEAYNEDSGETTDYKFTVIRAKDKASDEDKLEDLVLRTKTSSSKYAISLDKKFSANDYNYSATVDEDQKKVYVYADAEDTDAIVIVNGEICGSYVAVDLEKGANKIQIVCAAENCDDVTEYTVTVYRGEGSSELTGLTLYSGNTSIDLSPKFSKTDYAYTTTVANSIKGINIAPVTDAAYTVVKNTATGVSSTVYKSTGVGYLALNEGLNSLTVTTVGSDLSVSIYHVAVWRQPAKVSPTVSTQNLTVDGKAKTLSTYNISGNNFIKLRDLAALLDGTDKEFSISDTASTKKVTLTSDSSYKKLGTELTKLPTAKKSAATTWSFYLDGTQVKFTAYNIDGANYVMLRDMALFMDFGLTYNGTTRTIAIDTDDNYTPGK